MRVRSSGESACVAVGDVERVVADESADVGFCAKPTCIPKVNEAAKASSTMQPCGKQEGVERWVTESGSLCSRFREVNFCDRARMPVTQTETVGG